MSSTFCISTSIFCTALWCGNLLDAPLRLFTVGSTYLTSSLSITSSESCPWSQFPVISANICDSANWIGTIHHGLPCGLLPFQPKVSGGYLAFLGRIAPEKRPDRAIEIAVRTGMPLKIAAKVDRVDQAYWDQKIRPMVEANANVEYLGEIAEHEKADFLGQASALLFPVDWPEPFGLVMIEAMACGTPVIGFRCGSVPEVVEDGVSGFVVESVDQAAAAVARVSSLDRANVRAAFEHRFTIERAARDYLEIYHELISSRARRRDFEKQMVIASVKARVPKIPWSLVCRRSP